MYGTSVSMKQLHIESKVIRRLIIHVLKLLLMQLNRDIETSLRYCNVTEMSCYRMRQC